MESILVVFLDTGSSFNDIPNVFIVFNLLNNFYFGATSKDKKTVKINTENFPSYQIC